MPTLTLCSRNTFYCEDFKQILWQKHFKHLSTQTHICSRPLFQNESPNVNITLFLSSNILKVIINNYYMGAHGSWSQFALLPHAMDKTRWTLITKTFYLFFLKPTQATSNIWFSYSSDKHVVISHGWGKQKLTAAAGWWTKNKLLIDKVQCSHQRQKQHNTCIRNWNFLTKLTEPMEWAEPYDTCLYLPCPVAWFNAMVP